MKSAPALPLWLSLTGVALVVILIYAPALSFPFVWTDHGEIEQGALVPKTPAELWRSLTLAKGVAKSTSRSAYKRGQDSQARYAYFRPVKALSYGLDHLSGDGRASSYHLTNLLLHLFCCWALLLFLRRLAAGRLPGLPEGVAILHAVNPLHAEVVGWISARSDSLVALFALCAAVLLLRSRTATRPWLGRLGAGLMCCLALGAKETGLVSGPLLVLLSALVPADDGRPWWRRVLAECWLAGLLLGALVAYRLFAVADIQLASLAGRRGLGPWTIADLFGRNLLLSFLPLQTSVADTVEVLRGPSLAAILGPAAWLGWLALGIRLRSSQPLVLFSALAWLLFILPVAQLFPLLHPRGDRYLYAPAIFSQICLVLPLSLWLARPESGRPRLAVVLLAALTLTALAATARLSLDRFGDERLLFSSALEKQPHCIECWNNLAFREAIDGRTERAVQACRAALAVDRDRFRGARDGFSLRFILSRALMMLGRGQEAVPLLEEIVVRAGPSPKSLVALAEAYLLAGRPAHALAAAEWALRGAPAERRLLALAYHAARAEHDAGFPWLFDFPEGCLDSGP